MSRATSQRRASRASPTRTTATPIEPASYTTVTSQVMLHGGGWITWVMARSIRESYRMISRQHTRTRTAAASRTPSLPRRRRWPLPTGANMTERHPRTRCCSGGALAPWMTSSVIPVHRHSGGENLGLLALELFSRDDSAVTQFGQLGELVGGARRTRGLLDVGAGFRIRLPRLLLGPFLHAAAPDDQVDQDADQRDEQHENEPQCLRPAGQVMAAEDVDENI